MGEYVQARAVGTDARSLFDYLATVRHLPQYCAAVVSAEPTDRPGQVHLLVTVDGVRRERTAWLRRDPEAGTMQWYSDGPNGYHGQLAVTPDDVGTTVTVTIDTERGDSCGVAAGLEHTLTELSRRIEGHRALAACDARPESEEST